MIEMVCQGCGRRLHEIPEFKDLAWYEQDQPEPTDEEVDQIAWEEEGTLNVTNGHFLCNVCYIRAGQPSLPFPNRWVCP